MSIKPAKVQFNGGEISPWLEARYDIAKFDKTAKLCRNFIPLIEGSIKRRGGSRFVANCLDDEGVRFGINPFPLEAEVIIEGEKRELEKSMLLAPMCERIASEWLTGNIERELDILMSYGMLDGVPDELMYDGSIAIEFESPAVRMQDASSIMGLYKTVEAAVTLSQTNPSVLDIFDMESALRKIADYHGVDSAVVRTKEDVEALKLKASMKNAEAMMGVVANPLLAAMNSIK